MKNTYLRPFNYIAYLRHAGTFAWNTNATELLSLRDNCCKKHAIDFSATKLLSLRDNCRKKHAIDFSATEHLTLSDNCCKRHPIDFSTKHLSLSDNHCEKHIIDFFINRNEHAETNIALSRRDTSSVAAKCHEIRYWRAVGTQLNKSAVQKHIKSLKEKGVITRIGGSRGYWQVTTTQSKEDKQ